MFYSGPRFLQVGGFCEAQNSLGLLDLMSKVQGEWLLTLGEIVEYSESEYAQKVRAFIAKDRHFMIEQVCDDLELATIVRNTEILLIFATCEYLPKSLFYALSEGISWVAPLESGIVEEFAAGVVVLSSVFPSILSILTS